jgi:hypothetical protein
VARRIETHQCRIRGARDVDGMIAATGSIPVLVDRLLMSAESVTRVITTLNDRHRAPDRDRRRCGSSRAPSLLDRARAKGALSKRATDQDNGVIFADGGDVELRRQELALRAEGERSARSLRLCSVSRRSDGEQSEMNLLSNGVDVSRVGSTNPIRKRSQCDDLLRLQGNSGPPNAASELRRGLRAMPRVAGSSCCRWCKA